MFAGILKGLKRISGKLYFGDQIFEGEFENDKPKEGALIYPNGNEYKGLFKNGQRCKFIILFKHHWRDNIHFVMESYNIMVILEMMLYMAKEC